MRGGGQLTAAPRGLVVPRGSSSCVNGCSKNRPAALTQPGPRIDEPRSTTTTTLACQSGQTEFYTGRIRCRHHAYHNRRQIRPLRGTGSEVSLQIVEKRSTLYTGRDAHCRRSHRFTKEEFEDLCFDFGIELDEDTEEDERPAGVPPELKIGSSWKNMCSIKRDS